MQQLLSKQSIRSSRVASIKKSLVQWESAQWRTRMRVATRKLEEKRYKRYRNERRMYCSTRVVQRRSTAAAPPDEEERERNTENSRRRRKEKGRGVAKHSERSDEARSGRGWPLEDLVNKKAVAAAWVVQSSGMDEETRRKGARCKSRGRGKTERFIESTTRTLWKQWVLGRESRWEHKFPAFCVKACRDSVKRTQGWGLGCDRRGRRKKVEEEWNGWNKDGEREVSSWKKKETAQRRIAKGPTKEWEKLRDGTIRPGKREFRSL